jgi:PKD repeat protein
MRKCLVASFVGVLFAAALSAHGGEHTVVLQQGASVYGTVYSGTEDSHLYSCSSAADSNYGRYAQMTTGGSNVKRLLVKFKVFASEGGPVPDGATVSSASLKLYKTGSYDYGPYSVHRILKGWKETEVTWNSAASGDAWNTAGCEGAGTDRSTDPVATPQIGWDPGWMSVDVTGCVQAFAGGTVTNNGWLLVDTYGNYRTWAARDYTTDTSLRPKLEITYTGNTNPVAKAYALPSKGIVPFVVTFDASASTDVDGSIVSYAWDFGDGSDPGDGQRVTHTYSTATNFTATLTITDDEGGVDTKQFAITGYDANAAHAASMQEGAGGYTGTTDAAMYDYHADTNWYADADFKCGEGDSWRPAIRFKVFVSEGGSVPDGAEILSATLQMYKTSSYSIAPQVHQLKKAFVENEVTWNSASTGTAWESGGASGSSDRVTEAVASPWMGWDPGWLLIDVTNSIQALSDGTANHGWVITDAYSNIRWFASSENADQTIRPKLLITYRVPPTAVIATSPNPPKGMAPYDVSFDASGSSDGDGTILTYWWDFGDGNFGEGVATEHTYTEPGLYKAELSVTDDQGSVGKAHVYVGVVAEGSGTETIVVQDGLNEYAGTEDTYLESWAPDTARGTSTALKYRVNSYHPLVKFSNMFSAQGGPVPSGRRVKDAKLALYKSSAYDSTCGAKKVLRAWTETGATWNKANATTNWTTPGAMKLGEDVDASEEAMVAAPWAAGWVEFPVTGDVEKYRKGTLTNNGWMIWRYWGNTNSKSFHASEYATDSTLRPKLVIQISDNSAPVARAETDITSGNPPLAVQFTGIGIDADGTIASYSWDFGDGSEPVTGQNPVHTYTASGRFTATLTVTDDGGLTAEATVYVEVDQPYTLTFQEGDGGEYSDTEDTHIKEYYPTLFAPGGHYLETQSAAGNVRKSLIRFPGLIGHNAGQIPHDAKIVSAKLRLTPSGSAADQQIAVYRVSEGWSIPYASPRWTCRRAAGAAWSGGDGAGYISEAQKSREGTPLDTQTMDGRPFPYEWDITEAVQAWANDSNTNHGLTIEALSSAISFRSSDSDTQSLRPILLVTLSDLPDIQKPKLTITSQLTSQTKRAFIEGTKDPEVDTINLTADGNPVTVTVTNATSWHAFVERSGSDSVAIVVTSTDSEGNETQITDTLTYTPVDAASPTDITMQAGDSALIIVTTSHPDANSVQVVPGDGSANMTGGLSDTFEVLYATAGEYTATVNVLDDLQAVVETHEVNIAAVTVTMKEGAALQVKQGYQGSGSEPYYEVIVEPAALADQVHLCSQDGDLLTVRPREVVGNAVRSLVVLERVGLAPVEARIGGASGRIMGQESISGFHIEVSNFFGNRRTRAGVATISMVPWIAGIELEVELGFGAHYTDGTTTKTFWSDEFEEEGQLHITCVVPESAPDFETTVDCYQTLSPRQQVGRGYTNGGAAFISFTPVTYSVGQNCGAPQYLKGLVGSGDGKQVVSWPAGTTVAFDAWIARKLASPRILPVAGNATINFYNFNPNPMGYPDSIFGSGTDTSVLLTGAGNVLNAALTQGTYDVIVRPPTPAGDPVAPTVRFYSVITVTTPGTLTVRDGVSNDSVSDSTAANPLPPDTLWVHEDLAYGVGTPAFFTIKYALSQAEIAANLTRSDFVYQIRDADFQLTWNDSWLTGKVFEMPSGDPSLWLATWPRSLYVEVGLKTSAVLMPDGNYRLPANAILRRAGVKVNALKLEFMGGSQESEGRLESYKVMQDQHYLKGYMLKLSMPRVPAGGQVQWSVINAEGTEVGTYHANGGWAAYATSLPATPRPTTAITYWRSPTTGTMTDRYTVIAQYTRIPGAPVVEGRRRIVSRALDASEADHRKYGSDTDMLQRFMIQLFYLDKGRLGSYRVGKYDSGGADDGSAAEAWYVSNKPGRTITGWSCIADEAWNFDKFALGNHNKLDTDLDLDQTMLAGMWADFGRMLAAGRLRALTNTSPNYAAWRTAATTGAAVAVPGGIHTANDVVDAMVTREGGRHSYTRHTPLVSSSISIGEALAGAHVYTDAGLGYMKVQPYNRGTRNLYAPAENLLCGAEILQNNITEVNANHATDSHAHRLWRAVFMYNRGNRRGGLSPAELRASAVTADQNAAAYADSVFGRLGYGGSGDPLPQ